jgi:hypothetical protein
LIAAILSLNFYSQAALSKSSLPVQNKFVYVLDSPGTFLMDREGRTMAVGEHVLKPNSQEVFGISDIRSHKSMFPARYRSFMEAAGAQNRQLDQVFPEHLNW